MTTLRRIFQLVVHLSIVGYQTICFSFFVQVYLSFYEHLLGREYKIVHVNLYLLKMYIPSRFPGILYFSTDEDRLLDVLKPDSELLRKISVKLNKCTPGVEHWRGLAKRLGLKENVYSRFEPDVSRGQQSPTEIVLEWLARSRPSFTVQNLKQALQKIERNDVIRIIDEHFKDYCGKD